MKTGSVSFVSKELKPKAIITISEMMLVETINNWVFSTYFKPNTFNRNIRNRAKSAIASV